MRVKTNVARHKRVKRLMKNAKGRFLGRRNLYRSAVETQDHAERYAHRDRRAKKGEFRALWITRIAAACEQNGINYSRFVNGLKRAEYNLDRRVVSEIAIRDPQAFTALVDLAKSKL